MLKIIFVCRNFNKMAGGIERVSSLIMNDMIKRGHSVTLLTWDESESKSHYYLDPKIRWVKLNLGSPKLKASFLLRIKRQIAIRQIIKDIKPSLIIGFQIGTFLAVRTSTIGCSIPTISNFLYFLIILRGVAVMRLSPILSYFTMRGVIWASIPLNHLSASSNQMLN